MESHREYPDIPFPPRADDPAPQGQSWRRIPPAAVASETQSRFSQPSTERTVKEKARELWQQLMKQLRQMMDMFSL